MGRSSKLQYRQDIHMGAVWDGGRLLVQHASYVRLANRYQNVAVLWRRDVGFRCVREPAR